MRYRTLTTAGTGYYFTRSNTPVTPSIGSKTFAVPAGLTFTTGASTTATSVLNPAIYMAGTVTSYASTTLVLAVTAIGTATLASDWVINTQAPLVEGDMSFGAGSLNFLVDSPDAVAQSVLTRLKLWTGEWFLDDTEGTPYLGAVLGAGTRKTFEPALRERILGTPGVSRISDITTNVDAETRTGSFRATIDTIYGTTTVTGNL
jgi:hypothetical protein